MKLLDNIWWVSIHIGAVSAFTSTLFGSSPSQIQPTNPTPSFLVPSITTTKIIPGGLASTRKHKMALSEENNSNDTQSPYPPDCPPRIDEQLQNDLMDSDRRIMLYEKEVEMIREQLDLKQDELLEEQNLFRDEKSTLMGKIAEFTTILARRDEELTEATKQGQKKVVDQEKQAELENVIQSLETQLQEKTGSLENEKRSSEELRKRFDDTEDALEFEQMNFEKERRALQELVTEERKQVKALQEKFKENGKSFETTREEMLNKIKNEEEKLSDTRTKWSATQELLRQVEERLEVSLQEKAQILKESEFKLDTEKAAMSGEIVNLQQQIKKDQARMDEIKSGIEKENKEFEESRHNFESKIETEETMIKDLQNELVKERTKYEAERSTLDQEIQSVTANLENVETQLTNERANFSKEKDMLEKKLANEIRVGKLKKQQMKKRYDEIRREMTDLWESSKRQARQEENRLRKKYIKKIDTVKAQVEKLENDLTLEKKRLVGDQKKMQLRHAKELEIRDVTIVKLEGSVANLGKIIAEKDLIIEEKNEQIKRYRTSFRQLAKLGFAVTGNKIKKVTGPLKRLVQNSPPVDDSMD